MTRCEGKYGAAIVLLALSGAVLGACEETKSVGSGCPNGVCPQALTRNDDVCMLTEDHAQVSFTQPEVGPATEAYICLDSPLMRRADGSINARVIYKLTDEADPAIDCDDRPFLRPVSAEVYEAYFGQGSENEYCELDQLVVSAGDGGDHVVEAGDGFFYDDFSEQAQTVCTNPAQMIRITRGATPWTGVTVSVKAGETVDENGELDPDLVCSATQGSQPVGTPCLPDQQVFYDSQIVLETRSAACGDGLCVAYFLEGDTGCELDRSGPDGSVGDESSRGCADPEQVERRAHCTCRCDGPPGADLCECPAGFSCINVVSALEPMLAGGYCVHNGEPR